MEVYREKSMLSIGRAVFFGGLAISLVMMGFAYDFVLSLRAGAILTLVMSVLLLWFAQTAGSRKLERTEVWLLLGEANRPRTDGARKVLQQAIAETFLYFTIRTFAIAVFMLALSILLMLSGLNGGLGNV